MPHKVHNFYPTPRAVVRQLASASTVRARRVAERRALAVAGRLKTASASRTFAAVVTLSEVETRATARWDARAASFAAFTSWLEDTAAPWLAAHPLERALIPKRLLPDAAWRSARAWSLGTGGTDPDKLTAEFNAAKTLAIARTENFTLPQTWHEEFIEWIGTIWPNEVFEEGATFDANSTSAPWTIDAAPIMAFRFPGWTEWNEEEGPHDPSGLSIEISDGSSWQHWFDVTWGNDPENPGSNTCGKVIRSDVLNQSTISIRAKFDHATTINWRPQIHAYRRWFGV